MIVKIENGAPVEGTERPLPASFENVSRPSLMQMVARGWAEYVPPVYDPQAETLGAFVAQGEAWSREVLPLSQEEIEASTRQRLSDAVQAHLDAEAQTRSYDGILSLCSYGTASDPQFQAEGAAGIAWRDSVWRHCYQVLDDVGAGLREAPTEEELIAEIPPMEWP